MVTRRAGRARPSLFVVSCFAALLAPTAGALAQALPNHIVPDGRTQTQIQVNGRTTSITTATISGGNAFNSFSQFQLGGGNTANLYVPNGASNLINLVRDGQTVINGTLNAYKNGSIGGNVYFEDPFGFVVGAGGVINVGSLTVNTPTQQFLDRVVDAQGHVDNAATAQLLSGAVPLSPNGVIYVRGTINAQGGVSLGGQKVTIAGPLPSHFIHDPADRHQALFEATVNTDGLQQGGAIVVQNGDIEITAAGDATIAGTVAANGAPGQNAGTVTATAGGNLTVASTAVISAKGEGQNSNGGHIKVYASGDATIADGATLDASAGTSGNGGTIETSAAHTLRLGAAKLLTGAVSGQAGTAIVDPATVVIGPFMGLLDPTATQLSVDTNGGNIEIDATNSITVQLGAYINTRQTVASGQTPAANDTTDRSLGNSGNITLNAPSLTLDGQLNAFVINVPGTSYTAGTITLTGLGATTIGTGGTLPSFDTNGANLVIDASSIGFASGGYLNTRATTFGNVNDTADVSIDNSGSITLDTPTLNLAGGQLNAFVRNAGTTYTAGTIALKGLSTATIGSGGNLPSLDTYGANLEIDASSGITLASGAYINSLGNAVNASNDTTDVSLSNAGNVTLNAPSLTLNGTINAFAVNGTGTNATAYTSGTITLEGLSTATIGNSGNLPNFDTHGADLVIDASSGITLASGAYINTRQTTAGASNDTTGDSTGNAGDITLNAPSLTLDGSLNAFAVNTTGTNATSYTAGTITLTGPANLTVGGAGNLPSFNTGGANLVLDATSAITLNALAYINTRQTASGGNNTAGASTGNSGDITLNAPSLVLNGALNAFALNTGGTTYTAGTITLEGPGTITIGSTLASLDTYGANLVIDATNAITLPSGAYINTRAVTYGGQDDTTDASTGNSGGVNLTAPTITVDGSIDAFAVNNGTSYTGGAVALNSTAAGSITISQANVTLGTAAQSYITSIVSNGGNIAINGTNSITLESDAVVNAQDSAAGTAAIDLSAKAVGNSGNITLNAPTITFTGGINPEDAPSINAAGVSSNPPTTGALLLAGANNGHMPGTITLTGPASFTFDSTDPVYGAGANLAIDASSSITLAANGLIDVRGGGYTTATLTAPTITFSSGINETGGFSFYATPRDGQGVGQIVLDASSGFTLGSANQIKSLGADIELDAPGGTIALGASSVINTTVENGSGTSTADSGDIILSAATISFPNGINNGGTTPELLAGANSGFTVGTIDLKANSFSLTSTNPVKTLGANIVFDTSNTGNTLTLGSGSVDSRLTGANAGNITFTAATIVLDNGINNGGGSMAVLAGPNGSFAPGAIALNITNNGFNLDGSGLAIDTQGANLAITVSGQLGLTSGANSGGGVIDTRVQTGGSSTANSGNISLTANGITFTDGINGASTGPTVQLLAGATGAYLPGGISLTDTSANGGFTFDSTNPIKTLGASIAFFATGSGSSITLNNGASIDSRTGTGSTVNSGNITLSAPTVTFATGINGSGTPQLLAQSNGSGAGVINLIATAANGGFTLDSSDPIVTNNASLELIATGTSSVIDVTSTGVVNAGTGGLTLSAPTVTVTPGASLTDSGVTLSQSSFDITSANSLTLPGQNVTLQASDAITVESGGYIDTRDWASGFSAGNSGSITLDAPVIVINGGTTPSGYTLDAGVNNTTGTNATTFTAGDITLNATANTTPTYPGGMYTTTTSITLKSDAKLRGKNVSATSSSTTDVSFTASAASTAAGLAVEVAEGLLAGIDVNVLGATSNASVDVQNGSSITATGDVLLSSLGSETVSFPNIVIQGTLLPGTLAILYGADKATVTTTVEGTINAGGNLTVAAYNNATVGLQSWADSNPLFNSGKVASNSLYAGGVTVAYGNIATEAAIEAGATINAGGQVAVLARNDNSIDVETTALALANSAVGFAVAVNDFTANATASDAADLGTSVDKVGSVLIEADNNTTQNITRGSTTTGANALQTVLLQLSAPGGAVGLGVGIGEAAAMGVVVGSGIPQGLSTASNSSSPVKVAATVAYADESLNATADIAGATGATAPDVQASGPVAVYARVTDNGVRLDASSSVGSAGPANANAISTGSSNSFSVALNLGFVNQDASAYIGPGAVVSGSTVGVGTLVYLPIDNAFVCASNPCSFSEFTSHLNGTLGLANDLASTYVSASSQANNFGIAGAVDYVDFTNSSSAWIGDYAQVTSTATGAASWTTAGDQGALPALLAGWSAPPTTSATITWATPVDVTAKTEVQTIDISGNICLSFNCTGGSSASATTLGGSFALIDYNDSADAGIGANAIVNAAGDLTVASDVDDEAFVISPTSGYGGKNSLAGLVVLTQFDDSSHASISNTAEVSAPDVNVDANQGLTVWSVTGGVTEGAALGVGFSISVNQIDTSTLAFVGDNSADELSALPGLGLPYVPASPPAVTAGISTNDLSVIAGSSGDVGAVSVAAGLAVSTTPTAGPPSAFSQVFSGLTSLLNGNGLGFSFLGGAAGGAGAAVAAPTPPTFGVGISGSASVDQTDVVTEAYLKGATVNGYNGAADANATTVEAVDDTYIVGGSGAASFVSAGSPTATSSVAIGGALSLLLTNNDTVAFISGSTVDSDAAAVEALAGAAETSVAIGITGNLSPPTAGGPSLAGSVSVAILKDATDSYVDDSTLSGDSTGTAQVVAYDHTQVGIGGGSAAVNISAGGAYGAAVTYVETDDPSQSNNDTGRQVDAEIEGSTVTGYTTVAVLGLDLDQIVAGSFTAAVAPEGVGFSGSATVAILNGTTDAGIVNDGSTQSSLSTVGSVAVLASGDSDSTRDAPFNIAISDLGTLTSQDVTEASSNLPASTGAGAAIISFAGGFQVGKNSVGLSIDYNAINETRSATIDDSSVTTDAGLCSGPCTVNVTAQDNDNIQGFAVGVSVALSSFAGAGSASANIVSNTITAQVGNTSTADTTITAPSVTIAADDNATIESFAGQVSAAPDGAAVGGAIAYNKIGAVNGSGGQVTAKADLATFDNTDSLTVSATSDGTIKTAAVAGAAGDDPAFAGSFTTNFTENTIDAALSGVSFDNNAGIISVTADDTQTIKSLAGSVSFSPSGGVGAGIAVNKIDDSTTAEIEGSSGTSIEAKDVTVQATAGGNIETLAIGIAISGEGIAGAGSIATNLNSEDVTAEIGNGADITARDNVGVIAGNTQTVAVLAGGLGGGTSVIGAGLSLVVNDVTDTTEAKITGSSTKVDALGTNSADTLTVNTGTLASTPGLTTLDPSSGPPSLAETTTPIAGLAVVATSEQGVNTNSVMIGASADLISIGASADIVTDIMGGSTKAHIDNASIDTRLTANPTASGYVGPQLYVDASSQVWTGNFVISLAGGGYAGTAAAVGSRLDRETDAYIDGADVGTLYTDTVTTQTPIGSVNSAGTPTGGSSGTPAGDNGNQSNTTIYQTTETKTLVPSLGAVTVKSNATLDSLSIVTGLAVGFGGGGAGTVIVNVFSANTNAYVIDGTLNAANLNVVADTASGFSGNEGSGAASIATSAAAGAFAVDVGNDSTLAYVGDPTGDTTTTVNLSGTLNVSATTENTLNSVVISIGAAGEAGIAAMADVTVITNTTTGSLYSVALNTPVPTASITTTTTTDAIGNETTVIDETVDGDADMPAGNVTVGANETINVTPQAGAGGAGGAGGIGAGANIVVLKSDTTAQIVDSNLNVTGNDVSVLAQSTKNVDATTGTAGAGGTLGIGATVALVLVGTGDTGDVMGQFTGGSSGGSGTEGGVNDASNGGIQNPDQNVGSGNDVNSQTSYNVANAISSSANDAVTAQLVGSNITAAQVSVTAHSYIGVSNFTTAVAVGGDAGIGGAVSFTRVYDTVNADAVGGTITTPSLTLTADAGDSSGNHTASDTATAGGGGLVGLGAGVADGLVDNEVSASLGSGVVAPSGDTSPISISINASDTSSLDSFSAGGGVGAVAVGVMVSNASKNSSVTAEIPNAASTETLSTASTPGITLTINASDSGEVQADAYGVSGGVLGSGAGAGAAASDTAHVTAEIGTGNALNIGSGSVGITASDTPDVETMAVGVAVAGGAGLGASIAQSTSSPTVLATVGDNASIGGSGALAVNATLSLPSGGNSTTAQADIGTGGILLSANAAEATAQSTPHVTASTGTDVHLPDGNVSLTANSVTSQNASSTGVSVGGNYAAGTSLAFAETGCTTPVCSETATTTAELGAGATGSSDRTGTLAVRATGTDSDTANTVAGSGAVVAGNATVATTYDGATVNAQVDGSASATGATNLAVGGLVISATHYDNFSGTADSVNAAAFGGSGSGVSNTAAATTTASIGNYVTFIVNSVALVSAENNFSDTNGGQSAEGAAGGVLNGAAAISETSLCSSDTPCAANVTLGNNVTVIAGTDPVLNPGGIDFVAVTMLQGSDQVNLTTGGALAGAGVTSHFTGTFGNTVTIGSSDTLTSQGDLDIGSYDQLFFSTVADVSTYGLGVAGIADATTTINPSQTVIIGSDSTLTAMGNVNLTAGNDPTGAYNSIVNGSATSVAYVYGLIAVPSASATVNEYAQTAVTVDSGAKVQSAQNVTIGGYPSTPVANVDGEAHFDELGIPFTNHDNNPNVTTPTAVITINGTVIAGLYYDLNVVIPDCRNSGDYCSELWLTDGTFDVNGNPTNLGNALTTATTGMPLTVAAGAPAAVAVYEANFDPGSLSGVLPSGVATSTVGAFAFGPLLASAGDVNLNATSFAGTGTVTAHGAPSITVRNYSPDYLVMSSVLIPDLAGGSINFTGSAAHDAATTAGLHINPVNQNGTPAIDIENDIGSLGFIEPGTVRTVTGVGDFSGNGPALYILGSADLPGFLVTPANTTVTGIVNLSGDITIINKLGSYGATEPVLGNQVNISIPNGFAVINIPSPGFDVVGGNPFSEWADFILWPGNNPAANQGFNGNVAAAYLANAAYNANGTYNNASAFTTYLVGSTGDHNSADFNYGGSFGSRAIFYGDCEYELAGDCSGSTAQNIANTMPGSGTFGFAGGGNIEVQVPIEPLGKSSYSTNPFSPCTTISCQYSEANLAGSANSTAVYGNNVRIVATVIDLGGTISGGRATNWTVTLPASLMDTPTSSTQLVGYTLQYQSFSFDGFTFQIPQPEPVYQTFYSGGGAIANFAANYNAGVTSATTLDLTPYLAPINPNTTNNTALPEVVSYNAQTNSLTVENINASAAGGVLQLEGAIVSTNPYGTIHMNAGLGQVAINNSTGLTLNTSLINAGSNAANGTVQSVVDIIDTLQNLQTWYVFTPNNNDIVEYTSTNLSDKLVVPTTGGTNLGGNTATYQPLSGERFEWLEQATLSRSDPGWQNWNLGNWQFDNQFGATSNLPWVYLTSGNGNLVSNGNGTGFELGSGQLSLTPQAWLVNNASLENIVFNEKISGGVTNSDSGPYWGAFHGCGGSIGDGCHYGYTENTNPGPDNNGDPAAVWHWNFITGGYLQLTVSVKADNAIGVNFSGSSVGSVSISSDSQINVNGQITNPNGNTSITATAGGILTDPVAGLVTSNNLALSATGGIGAPGQYFNATLGGELSATAGSAGVYVNLNSGATIGTISAQTGSSYGPVAITATGDLLAASSASSVTGSQINLSTTQGAIGSVTTPLNIDDVGPVVQNADGSISGAVTASAENDIVLTQTTGNFNVLSVASTAGNVVLTADAGNVLDARGVTGAAALTPAQLHLDGSAALADSVTPFNNLLANDYEAYSALLSNGTVSGGVFTLSDTPTNNKLPLYQSLAIVYLNSLNPTTPVTAANITTAQIQQYAQHLYTTYTGDFATYLGANWASQSEFTQTIPNYVEYWALVGNGSVSGSTFTLSNAGIAAYKAAAVVYLNQQNPTSPVTTATITNTDVQAYAQTLYTGYTSQFATDLGANWQSQTAFQSDLLTLTTAEAANFTKNSVWTPAALASFVENSALQPASTVVGSTTTPNVTGRNVTLVSHAGSGVNGDIGALAPSLPIPVSAVTGFTLTPAEEAALQLAIAPGEIVLEDQNGNPINFGQAVTNGHFATGITPTTFVVSQTAPFFLTASGNTTANAAGAIYLQSTGANLTIANIVAGASINLAADESIIANGTAPQVDAGGSLTMAANGSIGVSGTPVNYAVGGDLLSAVAGGTGNVYVEYDGGNMRIGQVGAGGTAWVDATHGGIVADPALDAFEVVGGSVVLNAQTNIGSRTAPLQVETTALTGTLTGTAGTQAYLLGIGTSPLNIATLTAPTGIDITTGLSVPLTAQTLTAANGFVTVGGGNSVAIDNLTAGSTADVTSIDAMTLGAATGTSLLKSGAGFTIGAGDALTVNPDTEIQSLGGLTLTADSLAMDAGASMVVTDQVSITTTHDATLGAISTAYNGDHAIDVTAGSANGNTIVDLGAIAANGDNVVNLSASQANDKIYLTATNGVGALDRLLTVETPQIEVTTIDGDIGIYAKQFAIHVPLLSALFGNVTFNGDATLTLDSIVAGEQINSTTTGGALVLGTTQSGGSQTFQALDDISFTSLTSTGIAGDRGDIGITSTSGSVYGTGATSSALTGEIDAYGDIGVTSHGTIEIETLISNAGQTLQAGGDIEIATATTHGLVNDHRFTPDNGNFSAISSAGAVNIPTVTAYGTALIKAVGAGGTITVTTVTSGGQQELDATDAITFTEMKTTGLGADNGNLIVDSSAGTVLGTGATPTVLTGTLDANGTLKVTAGDAIEVETLTSNGAQTLQAQNDIDYGTVTTYGLNAANDNGNFSATATAGDINGATATVNGTATLKAQGATGAITVGTVTSGGQQELDATDAITFMTLKTTGLGTDKGNLIVDSSAGAVLGTGATPTVLTGTLDANGTLSVTAGDAIEVATLTSNGTQTLQAQNDIDYGTITTNGLGTDNGNLSATSTAGNINGSSATVHGTATLKAQGPTGAITVTTITSGGQQELDATDAVTFTELKTTGLGTDNGNLIVDSTDGTVLGTGATPAALTGTLDANGTLKVTAGATIEVETLTSNGTQTLQAQNDIDFHQITTNGLGTDNGNLSAISTAGAINGNTVNVEGTALVQALGPSGAITIDSVTSDGQQELDATNNVEFVTLKTEGLGTDNGNVIINATNGAILGEGAAPAALAGTINSNGTVSVTAAGPIELLTVTSNGTQHYLAGGDLDFGSLTTFGMPGDAGDVDGIAVGDINGDTIVANGDVTLLATNINVSHITATGATFEAHKTLTLPDVAVKTFLDLGADVMTVTARQIPAVPASATLPLQMNITGFNDAIGTQATLNVDAPAGLDIGKLYVGKVTLITTAENVNIADADVPHWLWLKTPDPIIYVDNDSPRPVNGVQVQLYSQDGKFALDQISNTTYTGTHVVYYEPGYGVVGETTFDGNGIVRNAPNDATWTIQYPTTFNLQRLLAYFPMIVPAEDGGAAVNLDMDDNDTNQ